MKTRASLVVVGLAAVAIALAILVFRDDWVGESTEVVQPAIPVAAVTPVDQPPARCTLHDLASCRDTNQLVHQAQFVAAVSKVVGDGRADYLYRGPLAQQALEVLGGPPDPPVRIGELYRFTACRAHSCPEKGVAVLTPAGELVAVGILHGACSAPRKPQHCYAQLTLSVFLGEADPPSEVIDNLSDWARAQAADAYVSAGIPPSVLKRLETFRVKGSQRLAVSAIDFAP